MTAGTLLGMRDIASMLGLMFLAKVFLLSTLLMAQAGIPLSALQEKQTRQDTRLAALEERSASRDFVRNIEYGVLAGVGALMAWFAKRGIDKESYTRSKLSALNATQVSHNAALGRIETKVDHILSSQTLGMGGARPGP